MNSTSERMSTELRIASAYVKLSSIPEDGPKASVSLAWIGNCELRMFRGPEIDFDSRALFTAAVHHAHFSRTALADRGTQPAVRYAETIDQLTSQATSLANWNDRIVRLLKWDVRHTLC